MTQVNDFKEVNSSELSVIWADRNVGAISTKDPGEFYAWGSTSGRKIPYNVGGVERNAFTNGIDATAITEFIDPIPGIYGQGWRTPTALEMLAIIDISGSNTLKQSGCNEKIRAQLNSLTEYHDSTELCADGNVRFPILLTSDFTNNKATIFRHVEFPTLTSGEFGWKEEKFTFNTNCKKLNGFIVPVTEDKNKGFYEITVGSKKIYCPETFNNKYAFSWVDPNPIAYASNDRFDSYDSHTRITDVSSIIYGPDWKIPDLIDINESIGLKLIKKSTDALGNMRWRAKFTTDEGNVVSFPICGIKDSLIARQDRLVNMIWGVGGKVTYGRYGGFIFIVPSNHSEIEFKQIWDPKHYDCTPLRSITYRSGLNNSIKVNNTYWSDRNMGSSTLWLSGYFFPRLKSDLNFTDSHYNFILNEYSLLKQNSVDLKSSDCNWYSANRNPFKFGKNESDSKYRMLTEMEGISLADRDFIVTSSSTKIAFYYNNKRYEFNKVGGYKKDNLIYDKHYAYIGINYIRQKTSGEWERAAIKIYINNSQQLNTGEIVYIPLHYGVPLLGINPSDTPKFSQLLTDFSSELSSSGDYYAYGDIHPRTTYNTCWAYTLYEDQFSKYNSDDNLSKLESVDDVALKLESGWRMPTKDEVEEMISKAKTKTYDPDNYCMTLTFEDGSVLHFPLAEAPNHYLDWNLYTTGTYWTSEKTEDDKFAYNYVFHTEVVEDQYPGTNKSYKGEQGLVSYDHRYYGFLIRPVKDK